MNFIEIPKNIPMRKYLLVNAFENTWNSNHLLGIIEMKIDGAITMTDENGYLKHYYPFQISPLKDPDLNKIGVNHLLYVHTQINESYDLKTFKDSSEFKALVRENAIDKIIK